VGGHKIKSPRYARLSYFTGRNSWIGKREEVLAKLIRLTEVKRNLRSRKAVVLDLGGLGIALITATAATRGFRDPLRNSRRVSA
jgi:hypothetical protein